jgi:hypothetical protein
VMAEISKGLKTHGVASAVDNVLTPLLREYEEGFLRFQKSAQAEPPQISTVWERVRVSSSVAGFMAQSAVGADGSASLAELQKQCETAAQAAKKAAEDLKEEKEKSKRVATDLGRQMKNLRDRLDTDDEGGGDGDGPGKKKKKKKKKKKNDAAPSADDEEAE